LHVAARRDSETTTPDLAHDRVKRRRLEASDPLFALLGVTTRDGAVKPTRMAKFRQVQDLLAAIDPLVDAAVSLGPGEAIGPDRPLRLVDLGCGNAYLTFAAFRYLSEIRALPVTVVGVDVKAQALAHNSGIADALGVADRVSFIQGSIEGARPAEAPDLVLALHACDTATDGALARAVAWKAPVIVAAPCCHHDISRQLSTEATPAPYRLITRHGILRERLADVLTDALRAALLRLTGYRVEVIEFVDTQHTPRNALIRAVRTGAPADDATWHAYRDLKAQWGVLPALEPMLRAVVPELAARLG
jgi:SAM-dependent methyltransferase